MNEAIAIWQQRLFDQIEDNPTQAHPVVYPDMSVGCIEWIDGEYFVVKGYSRFQHSARWQYMDYEAAEEALIDWVTNWDDRAEPMNYIGPRGGNILQSSQFDVL